MKLYKLPDSTHSASESLDRACSAPGHKWFLCTGKTTPNTSALLACVTCAVVSASAHASHPYFACGVPAGTIVSSPPYVAAAGRRWTGPRENTRARGFDEAPRRRVALVVGREI